DLCCCPWEVKLSHSYREANCAADYLANSDHYVNFGVYFFDAPVWGHVPLAAV
ncbi:hypothetical protein LINGRAHAP2_LOCUS24487, partial [Linum grandiflorum]